MPNLSALASQGVIYDAFYANANCAPSRRSAMTGKWWIRGNGDWASAPGQDTPPSEDFWIPEILGSHSSAIIGKWHLGAAPSGLGWECAPLEHGFDFSQQLLPANVGEAPGTSYTNWLGSAFCATGANQTTYQPHAVRDALVAGWPLAQFPRFAVVSANLAHTPIHDVPPPHTPAGSSQQRAKWEAMLVAYDDLIGDLVATVNMNHTLVIVVGDNGTPPNVAPAGQSGRVKGTVFERGVRVPCVMGGSGVIAKSRRSGVLAHVTDLWPTIIEWAGGTLPANYPVKGVSLKPTLLDQTQVAHETVLVGCNWGAVNAERGAVTLTRKLRQVDTDGDGDPDEEDLFDLVIDPTELVDVILGPTYATDLSNLRAFIEAETP